VNSKTTLAAIALILCLTGTAQAAAPVSDFSLTAADGQIRLYWAASPGATGVLVVRQEDHPPKVRPKDGRSYQPGDRIGHGRVIFNATPPSLPFDTDLDTGVVNGRRYFYRAYAYDGNLNYSRAMQVDGTPAPGGEGKASWVFSSSEGAILTYPVPDILGATRVFANTLGGHVYALDEVTGQLQWIFRARGPLQGLLAQDYSALYGSDLFFGDLTGMVYRVDVTTGLPVWMTDLRALLGADGIRAPVNFDFVDFGAPQDLLFVVTRNRSTTTNRVVALDPSSGNVAWDGPRDSTGSLLPMDMSSGLPMPDFDPFTGFSTGRLFVASRAGAGSGQPSFWVIDQATGSALQSFALGPSDHSPNLSFYDPGVVYVPTLGGALHAFNTAGSLVPRWTGPALLGEDLVDFVWEDFFTPGLLYFATRRGGAWALQDPGAGPPPTPNDALWRTDIERPSSPTACATTFYIGGGGKDGRLSRLRLDTGLSDWQVNLSAKKGSKTTVVGEPSLRCYWDGTVGSALVGASDGKFYSFDPPGAD
jgi:outer membrane protein assembly factor BamB